jgi:hypothetical protein
MSPERYLNDAVGPAADIFSWAATIAYAAAGRAPFGHDAALAIMRRVMDEPPRLTGLSPRMEELLRQCLLKDPADRPPATDVLLRLVAKSGLKLEPAARRSIGELSTRVIPKQAVRDIEERRRRILGLAAEAESAAEAPPRPARHAAPQHAAPQQAAPQQGAPQQAPPQQAPSQQQAPPPQPAASAPPADDERTVKLSGGRGQTRKILTRPEPTREVAHAAGLTAESPRLPSDTTRVEPHPGQAWRDGPGIVLATVLGLLGCGAWWAYTGSVPAALGVGVTVLVVAYLARLLVTGRVLGKHE